MSVGQRSQSKSSSTKKSLPRRHTPPLSTLTPENSEPHFEPCAATGSFLLYAQRNVILVLHHDTLVIERRFELHREEIRWIAVDNVSERGAGRFAVSFDAGQTTIVWDILTGKEITRFVAYEDINVACFMRNGNIALGNVQGGITLFEPATNEHFSARTIFDPVTALAPTSDNKTFAIGYLNGSVLIATLQPAFTILHTLTTSRAPSRITGLAWHGSSSKQKTDMLATQTADGDLRVWSVPKTPHQEPPTIIRALGRSGVQHKGPTWFAWSKNGRILQHFDGETRAWDVRTKKVTYDIIPTIEGVTGVASYGPTATLFTFGHNHTVQQYDVNPTAVPLQVMAVQHAPANTPPTPPTNLEEQQNPYNKSKIQSGADVMTLPSFKDGESSADESTGMSPLQKIAREMDSLDQLESEIRDKVTPLSPTSSRASSSASRSSGGSGKRRNYLYDRPSFSRVSTSTGYDGTEFSFGASNPRNHDSMSMKSGSTRASHARYRSSSLRKEVLRSPDEIQDAAMRAMDLFPCTRARLREVDFRTPQYGNTARTPEVLQREMLSVVFGWNEDAPALIRDEMSRHTSGSASHVLLAKWLGDVGADNMASMVGSQSMTSSDWMLLALSSIGQDSQKKVGEAFVQRLLEKGDVHPAVAILIGLGEFDDAIEVYVSQGFLMEAVLLTCLYCPNDWNRQTQLLRKWGEIAVQTREPELAVRCFSCTSVQTSEEWFSPRAQDAVYTAQQQRLMGPSGNTPTSPPLSPPSRSASGRLAQKNASLKLITTFGAQGVPVSDVVDEPTPLAVGVTPIINSAMSPHPGDLGWMRSGGRSMRAPSSARTATPGAYTRRKRMPSASDIARAQQEAAELATPLTAARNPGSRNASMGPEKNRRTSSMSDIQPPPTAVKQATHDAERLAPSSHNDRLPSPVLQSKSRNASTARNPDALTVQIIETRMRPDALSPGPSTQATTSTSYTMSTEQSRAGAPSPSVSTRSTKSKAIDDYINSVEQARVTKRLERGDSRPRGESRRRGESRTRNDSRPGGIKTRDTSEARGKPGVRYIRAAKSSPSSPIPMSPSEIAQATSKEAGMREAEGFYQTLSPVLVVPETRPVAKHTRHVSDDLPPRVSSRPRQREEVARHVRHISQDSHIPARVSSRPRIRDELTSREQDAELVREDSARGRKDNRTPGLPTRSPSLPLPASPDREIDGDPEETQSDGRRMRIRGQSSSRAGTGDLQARRAASRSRVRERSRSRQPKAKPEAVTAPMPDIPEQGQAVQQTDTDSVGSLRARGRAAMLSRKELAAKELEERRLSLARRPSAPAIPLPGELAPPRPSMSPRSFTELGDNPRSRMPPMSRSQTADPDMSMKYNQVPITGMSTPSAPIGLPATPRAMRHPRFMSADPNDRDAPPVPMIPDGLSSLSGSSLSQVTGSNVSHYNTSDPSHISSSLVSNVYAKDDGVGPLLPSTVFGLRGPQGPLRAASAPIEKSITPPVHFAYKGGLSSTARRLSASRQQMRPISPPATQLPEMTHQGIASIDMALRGDADDDHHIVIIKDASDTGPIMLPELQHLVTPPPPPPPPSLYQHIQKANSEMMHIGIEGNESYTTSASDLSQNPLAFPYSMDRASTTSPSAHRRDRGSISDTFSSRMRGVADRMRSNSRSRTKSPQTLEAQNFRTPYETVLPPIPSPHQRRASVNANRAKSPYEQAMADQQLMPPPPPPAPARPPTGSDARLNETSLPPQSTGSRGGYRHSKEVRANMPPEQLQQGAVQGGFL